MEPQRNFPYWADIVGENWPAIGPEDWIALESVARDGVAGLDAGAVTQARHAFDEVVRSSAALEPVEQQMRRANPVAYVEALLAAADTFRVFAGVVGRTSHQILDIVEQAKRRIDGIPETSESGDEEDQQHHGAASVGDIVAEARAEVVDVATEAAAAAEFMTRPLLARIAEALGQPVPWQPERERSPRNSPGSPPVYGDPDQTTRPPLGLPSQDTPGPAPRGELGLVPHENGLPGLYDREHSAAGPAVVRTDSFPLLGAGAGGGDTRPPEPEAAESDGAASDRPVKSSAPPDSIIGAASDRTARPDLGNVVDQDSGTVVAADQVLGEATDSTVVPLVAVDPSRALSLSAVGAPLLAAAAAVHPAALAPAVSNPQSPAQARGVIPSAGSTAGAVAAEASAQPPARTPLRGSGSGEAAGSDTSVREAVSAAIAGAAAPSFVVGERVDGDLVLARTLLSGVLAVAGTSMVGPAWAISVMRQPVGLSVFITSNEGRGWLPAGLYLPSELSTPWVWAVSESSVWEGISDPVRILVEFGMAWARKSGARLSAVASSAPIDPILRARLSDVSMAGSVPAAKEPDFGSPGPGLVDRFGLVGSRRAREWVDGIPDDQVRARCVELAWNAHLRVRLFETSTPEPLGLSVLRDRILRAVASGAAPQPQWWDELRDADDLLAASLISRRIDVAQVGIGQLRTDDPGHRSEAALLRELVFQRRCDELVLLLATEPTTQLLREMVYAHGQIVDHPLFEAPEASAVPDDRRRITTADPTGRGSRSVPR
ncbi:hypothetical protein [Nocardia iowensis]|uniref:Uncharacterized protein n=1 Tax=Nocardia iowensis TaxID=204891 RepID=A0ABX8RYC7_NOCIO|nr:hypothetical protein [Nocardia iowensis]QXN94659.1 hypothetical protein KV110_17355 [Nocardia iowensis]